jgi:hypothetical protein
MTMTKKTTSTIVLWVGLLLATASVAKAQTAVPTKTFFSVNLGVQPVSQTIDTSFSVPVYNQTATAATSQRIGGGPLFDVSAGYKVWHDVAVSVGFSSFSRTSTVAGTASVPSPLFFNQFNTVDIGGASATRTDRNVYVVVMWFLPVTDKIDIALVVGPSFTRVKQELVTSVTIPAGTQNAIAQVASESATAKGVNVGFDATYIIRKSYGGGIFVRYNGGSVNLASGPNVRAGGFQMGIGARLRF